ncbi:glycosyltransferase [Methylobrevis pamukkalensis]|uniref:Glycosyl transferase family 2 n=1 Tax=Methylobrevis pamukkalensis TaxID=1439726 RepID=A0A1E3H3Y0_9HYPH|nr:glycosyltransferase family A protein [Methylobrevis pamukkalensis]ODN71010.1 hypothetical protein A6302_01644 [Methylobrevis pamukkalensis]
MEKIIVSLTSISHRMARLHLTLASLAAQDYPNFEVRVYVSPDRFLLDEGVIDIPPDCQALMDSDPRIRWMITPNIGSYRKLLPVLAENMSGEALIATADDDTIYPADWLSTLAHYYRRYNCIIAYRGHTMVRSEGSFLNYRRWMTRPQKENPSVFWLPTGKDGVLYNPLFFHRNVLNYHKALSVARTADDLWFKWHTALYNVPAYIVNTDYTTMLEDTNDGPSLYKSFNQAGANDVAIAALEQYSSEELSFKLATFDSRNPPTIPDRGSVFSRPPAKGGAARKVAAERKN